jgi:hypothetical protein
MQEVTLVALDVGPSMHNVLEDVGRALRGLAANKVTSSTQVSWQFVVIGFRFCPATSILCQCCEIKYNITQPLLTALHANVLHMYHRYEIVGS